MQFVVEHWESVAGALGTLGTLWQLLRRSDKAYRGHLATHFPTKREFHRLEYKVDKLLALQLGEKAPHLHRVTPPQD